MIVARELNVWFKRGGPGTSSHNALLRRQSRNHTESGKLFEFPGHLNLQAFHETTFPPARWRPDRACRTDLFNLSEDCLSWWTRLRRTTAARRRARPLCRWPALLALRWQRNTKLPTGRERGRLELFIARHGDDPQAEQ